MTSSPLAVRVRVRARRAALPVVLCAGLAAALTACGSDPDEGTNGVGKLSAPEIESKARTAADGADAVRLSGTLVSKGGSYKIDMKLKGSGGSGTVTSQKSTFGLLRVGDDLFLKAGAGFWSHSESGGAAQAAGKLDDKYVKVPSGDPAYQQLRGFTDKSVLLKGMLGLQGTLSKGDRSEVGTVRTVRIEAGKDGEGGTLDVSLQGTPYPLRFERAGGAGVLELADWNKDFTLAPPSKDATVDYGHQLPTT
ncbi:hypothetical protein AB0M94_32305 [Streptomyces xanthochromogenes]|uniref:hypothetical protein n=1 Tax=Streptomyces TaxID=1883 RepID=UPI00136F6848|nr:hypothetical protein [Streptomyces xanthochromogenes]MYV93821.1 hypothetical protein [Streptomyces sp. SID1034]